MIRARLLVLGVLVAVQASAQYDVRLVRSREISADLQRALSEKLEAALGAGGPAEAIGICNVEAPKIAAELSAQAGARVARTALKVRNPTNAPDANARAVLEDFQRQLRAGLPNPPERFESAVDGSARYMRAIITQPLCTVCHGPELAADVKTAIAQRYPSDEATGFAVGDLRGAFVVEWPTLARTPR